MSDASGIERRAAARDAIASRTRVLTAGILAVSAALSGLFAGVAGASAPGHKLQSGTSSTETSTRQQTATHSSSAIPPLPAAPGPGNLGSASPPAPTPAPAPSPTPSPPAVVSGGS